MNWWTFWDTHDINDHDVPFLISFNCLCKNTLLSRWKVRYVHTGPTGGKKLPCKYLPFWQKEKKNLNIKVKALLYWDLLGPRWQHGARSGCEQTRDQTYSAPGRKLSPLPHEHPTPASIPISELMCGQPRSAAPLWEWRPHRDLLCFSGWPTQWLFAALIHYNMQLPDVFHSLWVSQPCLTLGTSSLVLSLPSVNWGIIMCYRF